MPVGNDSLVCVSPDRCGSSNTTPLLTNNPAPRNLFTCFCLSVFLPRALPGGGVQEKLCILKLSTLCRLVKHAREHAMTDRSPFACRCRQGNVRAISAFQDTCHCTVQWNLCWNARRVRTATVLECNALATHTPGRWQPFCLLLYRAELRDM